MSFTYYEDPILGKGRAQVDTGSGGSGGSSYVGGDRINIAGGTISFVNSADIVNVTGASVTLQPDTAYKIYATSQAITLNANPPAAGKWAYEGHLEVFTAGTGYVVTGTNVVLANALEPDSVNNCTVRFHDGIAIISVEDHVAGYIVVNGSTSGDGSLYYGISTSTNDYVAFDASLNGTTIPLAGAVAEGEKHIVGNGYTETIVSGAINCTSKTTFANLAANGVIVSSGTLTLGDVFVQNVAVSGGGLAIEKVVGDGTGVIDLNGSNTVISAGKTASANGCVFQNGLGSDGAFVVSGAYYTKTYANLTSCTFLNNTATGEYRGAAVTLSASDMTLKDCSFSDGQSIWLLRNTNSNSTLTLDGTNRPYVISGFSGIINVKQNATLDLTGNTNTTPINPGDSVRIYNGATIIGSAGNSGMMNFDTASAYMLCTSIVKNGGIVRSHSNLYPPAGTYTGVIFSTRITPTSGTTLTLNSCEIVDAVLSDASMILTGTFESQKNGTIVYNNNNVTGTIEITSGTVIKTTRTGDNNLFSITSGSITVNGSCTIVDGNNESHTVTGGTYTVIKADGTTTA